MATKKDKLQSQLMDGIEFELRGACGQLFSSTDQEIILAGPAETGKTIASLLKCHSVCGSVAGAQGAIVRKTQSSLAGSVVKSFLRIIEPAKRGIKIYGGEKPERFIYPNGSVIWLGGMDNPNKVLSSERDFIYVNQAEELSIDDWETLLTRATGRGAVVRNPQLFGDCNPGGSMHWIRKRKSLRLITARHADNPSLYTRAGKITAQGKKSLAALNNLTGVRRKRLLEGIWATAEGAVYDMFDVAVHRKTRALSEMKRFFLAIDEGYTNPAVILLIGEDSDGRWHCFKEFYRRGVLQEAIVRQAKEWFTEYKCELAAVDEAAAGLIADLKNSGVWSVGGKGRVMDGIGSVQNRLKVQGDNKPRYTVDPSCVEHINEFESYIFKKDKDAPEKENDHSMDALRYLCDVLNEPTGAFSSASDLMEVNTGTLPPPDALETDDLTFDEMNVE